ncbi:MAG: hypothetical protein Q8O03_03740 [Nanoarchaeota archaeon]|nr:hypothetical protein [Nanoarchaeota archaeon]
MMMTKQPTAKCKKCGQSVSANSLILDNLYGMLVCPGCLKEKRSLGSKEAVLKATADALAGMKTRPAPSKIAVQPPVPAEVKERPVGWDSEDDYLERMHKQRDKLKVNFDRLDESRIRYVCTKCGFKFVYHTGKRYPSACPNCGTHVITSVIR